MSETPWKLHRNKRWQLSVILATATPLHIGSGEYTTRSGLDNPDDKAVEINACIKGHNDLPIVPGSTVKGKLREWLKARDVDDSLLKSLFGKQNEGAGKDQGQGGKAEFHDAHVDKKLSGKHHWPYWDEKSQTFVEASTAIDRHRQTALHQHLHYCEAVPPGVQFKLTVTGVMNDDEAALLIAALDSFDRHGNQPAFGADDANDNGRFRLIGHLKIKVMDTADICAWLAALPEKALDAPMAMDSIEALEQHRIQALIRQGQALFRSANTPLRLGLTLQFAGPFIVNDPDAVKRLTKDPSTKTDHFPLVDAERKPRLPTASFRGALRAQAEKIIRTLGGKCCDTENPCEPLDDVKNLNGLCLACQLFGATGWKSVVHIEIFVCTQVDDEKRQDFIAIDRFHGGGKDGAKFDATHFERPAFQGAIIFSSRMEANGLGWGKGLLKLVLRDLQEGDLTFGFGANKGYGTVEPVKISGLEQLTDDDLAAFRNKCRETAQTYPCSAALTPATQAEHAPPAAIGPAGRGFHNPYHFIPIQTTDTSHWLSESQLRATTHHSHAFYRDKTDDGQKLLHGRLICCLTTETPTFIGADKTESSEAAEINNFRLNGQIALPAASLRGMISSLAEAASQSAMRVVDDGLLSYRKAIKTSPSAVGMIVKKDKQWHLIPLALPTLKKRYDNNYALPQEYQTMFGDGQAKLKVYLNNAFTDGIDQETWTLKSNRVFYLALNAPQTVTQYKIIDNPALRKPASSQDFVIGLRPMPNSELQEQPGANLTAGLLRILGGTNRPDIPNIKKHELFIPVSNTYVENGRFLFDQFKNNETSFLIPDEVIDRFHELSEQCTDSQKNIDFDEAWLPYHLKGMQRNAEHQLRIVEGDLVFFKPHHQQNHLVEEISFSSIWRGRVETSAKQAAKVQAFIPADLRPFNRYRTKISPAELLFGFCELNQERDRNNSLAAAFAGKVRVSPGIIPAYSSDDAVLVDGQVTLKALSTPKLPSPALYFRSINGDASFIEKNQLDPAEHRIQGRKYYLHALRNDQGNVQPLNSKGRPATGGDSKLPWETHDPGEKPKLKVKIRPIKKGQAFYFHLDFNNLTEWELGLLCFVLKPFEAFRHRLGMGKPIGLGSVNIDVAALQTVDRIRRYGSDPVTAERYNAQQWVNPAYRDKLNDAGYPVAPTGEALAPETLAKIFADTIDADVHRALTLLGDPQQVQRPVHYPQVADKPIEQENYQWFVANDKGSGQGRNKIDAHQRLETLGADSPSLPSLTRHRWKDK